MAQLTIVAHIHAKEDQIDRVKQQLTQLVEPTRNEDGCINYDLHQDNENPAHFMFFENWESRALWQDHMASEHIQAYRKATEGAIADFTLYEMTESI